MEIWIHVICILPTCRRLNPIFELQEKEGRLAFDSRARHRCYRRSLIGWKYVFPRAKWKSKIRTFLSKSSSPLQTTSWRGFQLFPNWWEGRHIVRRGASQTMRKEESNGCRVMRFNVARTRDVLLFQIPCLFQMLSSLISSIAQLNKSTTNKHPKIPLRRKKTKDWEF
jgi:hypothetical protein